MKKFLISIIVTFCVVAAPLCAFEWGGLITDDTGFSIPDYTLNQSNGISLWFNTPIGEDFSFSGEALYKYNFNKPKDIDGTLSHLVDVPLLKFSGEIETSGGSLELNAGRFNYVDKTSAVYSNTCDGVSVDYTLPLVKFGAFAGYTGLVNSLTSYLPSLNNNKFYNMAYAYAPVSAYVEFPALLGNQSFGVQGLVMLDLGSIKKNSYFANITLSGPVTNRIYYSLVSSLGSVDFDSLMLYSAFSLIAFPADGIFINAGAEFGSAEGQGGFSSFASLASSAGGKIVPKLGFTFATNKISFDLSGRYNLAYDGSGYKGAGIDASAGIIYNIFSDFQVGLNFKASLDPSDSAKNTYAGSLNVALAF